ncbi:MAG TPA: HD domain-containing phosphohydrolase [Thermoanaerobaculia bacterium]
MKPFFVLLDPDPDPRRREALAAALARDAFRTLAVGLEASPSIATVSPDMVVLNLLSGMDLLPTAEHWHESPDRATIPLAALVPAGDEVAAETARLAGIDEVVPWPPEDGNVDRQLRSMERHARLQAEVSGYEKLLVTLVAAFEGREPFTLEHGHRVARISVAMGSDLGFSADTCHLMHRGALLHDIGLMALSDQLVHYPGALGPEEFSEVQSHPVIGFEMLRGVPSLEPLLPFVYRHHERIDGSGFPDGLVRSEIPLLVQIVSIADAWDSLRSPRAYRSVFSHGAALEVIADEARKGLWDNQMVRSLERAVGNTGVS